MTAGGRIRVAIVFGGRSAEHEVSLRSAAAVASQLDPEKYEAVGIGVTREGRWLLSGNDLAEVLEGTAELQPSPASTSVILAADPSVPHFLALDGGRSRGDSPAQDRPDVIFPLIHGTLGEDGSLQGLLELAGIPYVGCGVLASAVGMDKALFKTVMRAHGIPVVPHLCISVPSHPAPDDPRRWHDIAGELGYPLFVKPANGGSSLGIVKVMRERDLVEAITTAAEYDRRVLLEAATDARELDCGVLGNDEPEASVVGETIPGHEFHDYDDKYFDNKARVEIPARISSEQSAAVRELSIRAFQAIDGAGMARVDFFLERASGKLFVNEINTIPGFSRRSTYPRLWAATGLPFPLLLDRLIRLGLERAARERKVTP